MPAAEWWTPLLVDLAAIQRGSVPVALRVDSVDLTADVPQVTVSWAGGTPATFTAEPAAGREALFGAIAEFGPVLPAPEGHDDEFWIPGDDASALLGHAWLMDDLGRHSDAWHAYVDEPVALRQVRTDCAVTEVTVGRTARGDVVRVRLVVRDWQLAVGCGYAVVERAIAAEEPEVSLTLG